MLLVLREAKRVRRVNTVICTDLSLSCVWGHFHWTLKLCGWFSLAAWLLRLAMFLDYVLINSVCLLRVCITNLIIILTIISEIRLPQSSTWGFSHDSSKPLSFPFSNDCCKVAFPLNYWNIQKYKTERKMRLQNYSLTCFPNYRRTWENGALTEIKEMMIHLARGRNYSTHLIFNLSM